MDSNVDSSNQESWDSAVNAPGTDPIWWPEGYQLLRYAQDFWQSREKQPNGAPVWIKPAREMAAEAFKNYLRRPYPPPLRCDTEAAATSDLYFVDGYTLYAKPGVTVDPASTNPIVPRLLDWMPVSEWIDAWANAGNMIMVCYGAAGTCNYTAPSGELTFGWVLAAMTPQDFKAFHGAVDSYIVALPGSLRSTWQNWQGLASVWLSGPDTGATTPDLAPPTQTASVPAPTPPASSDGGGGLLVGGLLVVSGLLGLAYVASRR